MTGMLPPTCPRYPKHGEMAHEVIHDHYDDIGLRDCGIKYQCPICFMTEWAVFACRAEDDDGDGDE